MISSFFKTKRARQFSFKARYYDEDKEEMQERYSRIQAELNQKDGTFLGSVRKKDFKTAWRERKKTSNFEKKSNLRLVVIFALLCGLCYYILFL